MKNIIEENTNIEADKLNLNAESVQGRKNLEFQAMLNKKFNNEIELLSDYKQSNMPVKLRHITCGSVFYKSKRYIDKKRDAEHLCGNCEGYEEKQQCLKNQKFDNWLKKEGFIDYIRLSDYISRNKDIVLLHIKCNKKITITPANFYKKTHKCSYCYKNERKKNLPKKPPKNEFYQAKIDKLTNGEFLLLSDYYNLSTYVTLQHKVCGHKFTVRADNFERNKDKCPKCANRSEIHKMSLSQRIKEIQDIIGDEYEILTDNIIFNTHSNIKIKHKRCGNIIEKNIAVIKKMKDRKSPVICKECHTNMKREDFLDELNRIYGDDYTAQDNFKYRGLYEEMSLYHRKCGKVFKVKPINMLLSTIERQHYCHTCKDDYKKKEFEEKINNYYGPDYELVGDYKDSFKYVEIRHKVCGTVIRKLKGNLFKKSKTLCVPCGKKERTEKYKILFVAKLNNKYNGEIKLVGDYVNIRQETEFHCLKCDSKFYDIPDRILYKIKGCPCCE